jgi:hypothetical protein
MVRLWCSSRWSVSKPNTKEIVKVVANLGLSDQNIYLVIADTDQNILLSSRNLPNVDVIRVADLKRLSCGSMRQPCIYCRCHEAAGRRRGGCVMKHVFDVIKKPLFTEKGMDMKESDNRSSFRSMPTRTSTRSNRQWKTLQGEGRQGERRQYQRKEAPLWQVHRHAFRQEKGDCNPENRVKNSTLLRVYNDGD